MRRPLLALALVGAAALVAVRERGTTDSRPRASSGVVAHAHPAAGDGSIGDEATVVAREHRPGAGDATPLAGAPQTADESGAARTPLGIDPEASRPGVVTVRLRTTSGRPVRTGDVVVRQGLRTVARAEVDRFGNANFEGLDGIYRFETERGSLPAGLIGPQTQNFDGCVIDPSSLPPDDQRVDLSEHTEVVILCYRPARLTGHVSWRGCGVQRVSAALQTRSNGRTRTVARARTDWGRFLRAARSSGPLRADRDGLRPDAALAEGRRAGGRRGADDRPALSGRRRFDRRARRRSTRRARRRDPRVLLVRRPTRHGRRHHRASGARGADLNG